jgi:hypothetical protein
VNSIFVLTDTGKYAAGGSDGNGITPATLTVQLMFEDDKTQTVYKELKYSWAQVQAMATMYSDYTFIQKVDEETKEISYYQANAKGVPFLTLFKDLGAKTQDIKLFRVYPVGSYAGQYAGGMVVSYDYLFGYNRYAFGMIGRDGKPLGGATSVYPMLAVANSWYSCSSADKAVAFTPGDYSAMNSCSRLMFGSTSATDVNSSRSVHSVERIVVLLKGDLPVQFDKDDKAGETIDEAGKGGIGGVGAGGTGTGTGDGAGSGVGDGTGVGGTGSGSGGQVLGAGTAMQGDSSAAGGSSGAGDAVGRARAATSVWHAYQVMQNLASDIDPVRFDENPWRGMTLPAILALLALGVAWAFVRFKLAVRPSAGAGGGSGGGGVQMVVT